jgi:protein involved in polysaccharide export with SLBB domain
MKKNIIVCFLLASLVGWSAMRLDAQSTGTLGISSSGTSALTGNTNTNEMMTSIPSAQLAMSTSDYLVTAGDVYLLMYYATSSTIEYPITVDSTYKIRVSNLGVIDATGKTFNQLKTQVETIVSNNYPLGGVQFVLRQPSSFKVYLRGEVPVARDLSAWALVRLSTLLELHLTENSSSQDTLLRDITLLQDSTLLGNSSTENSSSKDNTLLSSYLTENSSIRDIQIRSRNGQVKTYDLFKAMRDGDLTQDPFVRPDDTIVVNRVERKVSISGAVERPGTYQILKGENLKDIIMKYGCGFTEIADSTRITLVRYANSIALAGEKIALSEADITNNFVLENYDSITIPDIITLRPVLFVEGAVNIRVVGDASATSNRLPINFNEGETYGILVRSNVAWFSAISDTQNAYIIRGNMQIPINLNPLLYDASNRNDVPIKANDTLVIPFRQYFISIAGAVARPGRYPYIPDRTWEYYIGLAGGFDPSKNSFDKITITDISGNKLTKNDTIRPETLITAESNKFLYSFNQVAPIITTSLSIISTFISLYLILNSL